MPHVSKIQERVRRFLDIECSAIYTARQASVFVGGEGFDRIEFTNRGIGVVGVLYIIYLPVLEVAHKSVSFIVYGYGDIAGYTLEVLYCAAEVDAAHGFD